MSAELLSVIRAQYSSFTNAERDIADYILKSSREAVDLSISELAYRCSVGETSVMRFCRSVGQPGYRRFRLALAASMEAEKSFGDTAPTSDDPIANCLEAVYQKHQNTLAGTRRMLTADALRHVVDRMLEARHICFFGLDRSLTCALTACQAFASVMWKCYCAIDAHTQRAQADSLTCDDAAVFFSHSGRDKKMLAMAEAARQAAAFSLAITCGGGSPLTELCDTSICCGCGMDPSTPTGLDRLTSHGSFAFVTEVLCTACAERAKAR